MVLPITWPRNDCWRARGALRCCQSNGTHQAYVNLITRLPTPPALDLSGNPGPALILVARTPSEDEVKLAADRKVELDVRPFALDGFVFIVNTENPVNDLTQPQIRGMYEGGIRSWKDMGGKDVQIRPIVRERNSGSQEIMEALVMGGRHLQATEERMVVSTMMGTIDRVADDRDAIAYSLYYYERFMYANPGVKFVAVDGVLPEAATIAARRYPLVTEVYAVVRKDEAADSPAVRMRDWLLGTDGQAAVAASGYVPLPPPAQP